MLESDRLRFRIRSCAAAASCSCRCSSSSPTCGCRTALAAGLPDIAAARAAGEPGRVAGARRGIIAPCSSRSTSATRRPTSARSTAPELVEHWRFSTDREATGDELAVDDPRPARPCAASASTGSTARRSRRSCRSWCPSTASMFERYLEREALIVGPGTKTGHADPARQPARAGRRPARERGRGLRPLPATPA